ncbi:putative quinol monooxygenase [Nocardia sp. NPDC004068]|uniref:putative quinol monooxygenase n=1 Tax=Nocardia sp. NPDC004068 TaxID=3364303 RepID=UPI00368B1416
MLIVAGRLRVLDRERYLEMCHEVVAAARAADGCLDYALGADLLEADRVNVYERWTGRAALDAFREGPGEFFVARIVSADVREFDCPE